MLGAHTVEDIRRAEESAAERYGWDGLMQKAADALADFLESLVPLFDEMVFLIGPGNNGGDGLFAAARLATDGRQVSACILDPERVHAAGLAAAERAGVNFAAEPSSQGWAVDALFGIGANAGLSGTAMDWARWAAKPEVTVIAVDVPSGIGVDDGTLPGAAIVADHTLTFGSHKIGLLAGPASANAGEVHLADIGLGEHLSEPTLEALEFSDGFKFAEQLTPKISDHKYSRGVLGILAGSERYPGAAHLCVSGALAGPLSMVRFLGDRAIANRVIDRAPEVVADAGRVQAFVVGSGGEDGPGPVRQALAAGVPLVIDATGLQYLPETFEVDALLTPHAGELARMLSVTREAVEAEPLSFARQAAARWNATVLLKGPRTVIAHPDGRARVNVSGTPWLATAGAGDVLAGFAGALVAAGLSTFDAGAVAALLHGIAAERANPGGPITASMVAAELGSTVADFLQGERA